MSPRSVSIRACWWRRIPIELSLLAGFLALPVLTEAQSYVVSVEYVEISLGGTETMDSAALTKGQTIANCVPFASMTVNGVDDDFDSLFTDVYFEAGPQVTARREVALGTVDVGVYVVEFDPTYVTVQQNSTELSFAGTSTTDGITAVDLTKAATVFYYRGSFDSHNWEDHAVAGWFSAADTLSFQRESNVGTVYIHWYVFEANNSEFSVQPVNLSIAASSDFDTASISSVDLTKSFVIGSYRAPLDDDNVRGNATVVYLSSDTEVRVERDYDANSYGISDIRVFVVELSGNVSVQRDFLSYTNAQTQDTTTISSVDLDNSIVWNGMSTGPGVMKSADGGSEDVESAFQRIKLTDATTVQGDRQADTGGSYSAEGVGRFEVIDFSGVTSGGPAITGTISEDVNGDGDLADAIVRDLVTIELYQDGGDNQPDGGDDVSVGTTTTNGSGAYTFTSLAAGTYWVVVDSKTVTPNAGLKGGFVQGDVWSEQTYGVAGAWCDDGTGTTVELGVTGTCFGGQVATVSDDASALATAEHVTRVVVVASEVSGVDSAFSFSPVVNVLAGNAQDDDGGAARTVQGSLRQFIDNANAIVGANTSRFVPSVPTNATDGGGNDWWRLAVTQYLPIIDDAFTTIDGTAYDRSDGTSVLNTNATLLGFVGSVGLGADALPGTLDEPTLSGVEGPELEIWNDRGTNILQAGLDLQADDVTVRNIGVYAFGDANLFTDGNIRIGLNGGGTNFTNVLIEDSVIGSSAASFTDPGAGNRSEINNIAVWGADMGTIRNNLIGFGGRFGIFLSDTAVGWIVQGNEIRTNALTDASQDGLDIGNGSSGATVSGNLFVLSDGGGVDGYGGAGNNLIENNTFLQNGQALTEPAAMRIFGVDNIIRLNDVENNIGPGVLVVNDFGPPGSPSSKNRISRNRFSGNGSNAIDLLAAGGDFQLGDGITVNDSGTDAMAGNIGLDYPAITSALVSGGITSVTGTTCANCEVEVYRAVAGAGDTVGADDYGEGVEFLGSTTANGLGDWTVGGISTLIAGDEVSAITIDTNDNTSEFGVNVTVTLVPGTLTLADHDSGQVGDQFTTSTPVASELFRFKLSRTLTVTVDSVRIQFTTATGVVNGDVTNGELYRDENNDGVIDLGDAQLSTGVTPVGGVLTFDSLGEDPGGGTNYIVRATVANLSPGDATVLSLGIGDIDELETPVVESGSAQNAAHSQDGAAGADVYYSVGVDPSNHMTGSPLMTIVNGTATFDTAQVGVIGVGDEIDYNAGTTAFIKSVLSQNQFVLHTGDGGVPPDVTDATVNTITRAFGTINGAVLNSDDAQHLNNTDLTASGADARVTWVLYDDGDFTQNTVIQDRYTTDATHFITLTVAGASDIVNGVSQRHNGTAGTGVVLDPAGAGHALQVDEEYTIARWLEITGWTGGSAEAVRMNADNTLYEYMLVHGKVGETTDGDNDGFYLNSASAVTTTIRNTTIYNTNRSCIFLQNTLSGDLTVNVENVTVYNCVAAIGPAPVNTEMAGGISNCEDINGGGTSTINVTNVISVGNTDVDVDDADTDFNTVTDIPPASSPFCDGTPTWGGSNNMSTDGSAIGASSITGEDSGEFMDASFGTENLHLVQTADAINAGVNLTTSFTDDIDAEFRNAPWDMGADEFGVTAVYYSVGVNGGDLKVGAPTLDIANGIATFDIQQANNVGVGDVITYNGSTEAYISGRTNSQVFSVRTATGTIPPNVSGATANSINRAFTSLSQAQTESIDGNHLGTADLVAGNFQLNWPCYDDGAMDDLLDLTGWTTGAANFIRIYTPVNPSEVGISQRHDGTAGTGFSLAPVDATVKATNIITVRTEFLRIEGIEIDGSGLTNSQAARGIHFISTLSNVGDVRLDSLIIHDLHTTQGGRDFDGSFGIYAFTDTLDMGPPLRITNNFIYDITASISEDNHHIGGIHLSHRTTSFVYNNTIFNIKNTGGLPGAATWGIEVSSWPCCAQGTATVVATNNYIGDLDSLNDSEEAFHFNNGGVLNQSANVSFDGSAVGATGKTNYAAYFQDINDGTEDLHLMADSLTLWTISGDDLSAEFTHDIDGGLRVVPWDIGADDTQATTAVDLVSFEAVGVDGAVELRWETGSELDNLGFHLYRSLVEAGPYEQITASVIPGLGSSPEGAKYAYRDSGLVNGVTYYYKLEDIETIGVKEMHGPVSATPSVDAVLEGGDEGGGEDVEEELDELGSRITFGDPSANELKIRRKGKKWMELTLITEGFYAIPQEDGSVLLEVPGFEDFGDADVPDIPAYRTWQDVLAGRNVQLASVSADQVAEFASLRPSQSELVVVASGDGTVQTSRRRRKRRKPRHVYYPETWAQLMSVGFQGASKKALLEMAPLRWDATAEKLVLSKRLVVRISFKGKDKAELKLGKSHVEVDSHLDRNVLARIAVEEPGLYGVSFESVFGRKGKARKTKELSLSRQGEPVAFFVTPNGKKFKRKSTLYFVSEGSELNPYGQEAVYELLASSAGSPMASVDGSPVGAPTSFYWKTVEREEDLLYQAAFENEESIWQWDWLFGPMTNSYPFEVTHLSPVVENSKLRVWLHGASDFPEDPDHHVRLYVNGTLVTETWWDGETPHFVEAELGPGLLLEGENRLEIEEVGDTEAEYSMVMLDRFEVSYPAELVDELKGSFSESGVATLPGGAGQLFDMTEPQPKRVTGVEAAAEGLSFGAASGHRYLLTSSVKTPEVRPAQSTGLKKAWSRAEYLVIGPREFLTAAEPLLAHRREEGLISGAIATEDIYEEFGFGEATPESIKDFLSYVYHHWSEPTLRYVVLLGDGTYDTKDYLATGVKSQVPVKILKTQFVWTASDPWYGAINGDDILPDVAIGRLPAASVEEVERLVQKILDYESGEGDPEAPVVLIADNPDGGGNFVTNAEELSTTVLVGKELNQLYLSELGTAATRSEILNAFDDGAFLMSYMGHGAIHLWANENLLNIWDVETLAPQPQQPFLLTMNCLNGYFHFPYFNSLSEELLKAEGKGIIAAFSPTGLSLNRPAHRFHKAILDQVVNQNHRRLGDAILEAQIIYAHTGSLPELITVYHLLGDPALKLR